MSPKDPNAGGSRGEGSPAPLEPNLPPEGEPSAGGKPPKGDRDDDDDDDDDRDDDDDDDRDDDDDDRADDDDDDRDDDEEPVRPSGARVRINEIESQNGSPGDWVELINLGSEPADVSGWAFKDDDNSRQFKIASGTVILPGAYLVLDEKTFGFGLGGEDAARLFDAHGQLVDSYVWKKHASTTYGRCPDGRGEFTTTNTPTKGSSNDCGITGETVSFVSWPGKNQVTTAGLANRFGKNLSGLTHLPASSSAPAALWAVQNSPSKLFRIEWNGAIWDTPSSWASGRTLRYPNGQGSPDAEGVTWAEWSEDAVYVVAERDGSGPSRLSVLRYDTSSSGAEWSATQEWNLTADLPVVGSNSGLEAITWVPDSALTSRGFYDESRGRLYDPSDYPDHGTGLFFVGLESNGLIYAYALEHVSGRFTRVATIDSGLPQLMSLEFDREVGYLWAACDDNCDNKSTVLDLVTSAIASDKGRFRVLQGFLRPSSLQNLNYEGIAFASESECVDGQKRFFWADDDQTSGHALRQDTIPCGRFSGSL